MCHIQRGEHRELPGRWAQSPGCEDCHTPGAALPVPAQGAHVHPEGEFLPALRCLGECGHGERHQKQARAGCKQGNMCWVLQVGRQA